MIFSTLAGAVAWIIQHGYLVLFLIMLAEGPVITAAAAFAAFLGSFNVWAVFGLSILGNLIPDILFYAIGYWGRERFIGKYGRYFGLSEARMLRLENLLAKHSIKSLFIIKLTPFLATPGLIVVGITRMKLQKYVLWSLIITAVSSLAYLIVGYYFGAAYDLIAHYVRIGGLAVLIFVALFAGIGFIGKKLSAKFAKRLDA